MDVAKTLLVGGAHDYEGARDGETPVSIAIQQGHADVVELLECWGQYGAYTPMRSGRTGEKRSVFGLLCCRQKGSRMRYEETFSVRLDRSALLESVNDLLATRRQQIGRAKVSFAQDCQKVKAEMADEARKRTVNKADSVKEERMNDDQSVDDLGCRNKGLNANGYWFTGIVGSITLVALLYFLVVVINAARNYAKDDRANLDDGNFFIWELLSRRRSTP